MIAILDSGPLWASINSSDDAHLPSVETLDRRDLPFVIPSLVVGEVAYFAARLVGPAAEARFLRTLRTRDVRAPLSEDWSRIAELVERYADFPLGTVDASVIALAERLETDLVVTLDHRHFRAMRPRHVPAFQILP